MKRFTLTENHIKLLHNMYISWDESYDGAPVVDIKRPYGNSSRVYDIYEIIYGEEWNEDCDLPDHMYEHLLGLHSETGIALQIVLCEKSFEPGIFEQTNMWSNRSWKRIE